MTGAGVTGGLSCRAGASGSAANPQDVRQRPFPPSAINAATPEIEWSNRGAWDVDMSIHAAAPAKESTSGDFADDAKASSLPENPHFLEEPLRTPGGPCLTPEGSLPAAGAARTWMRSPCRASQTGPPVTLTRS